MQRQSDNLLYVLNDVITERVSSDVRAEAVFCIAAVGSQMGLDLKKFFQWIFNKVQAASTDDVKSLLLLAVVQVNLVITLNQFALFPLAVPFW